MQLRLHRCAIAAHAKHKNNFLFAKNREIISNNYNVTIILTSSNLPKFKMQVLENALNYAIFYSKVQALLEPLFLN